ncbi:hypothetical protein SpCBS45565_g05213 [Spizellomyces sp. 'palustris']|nr:hypothetical protein SpCBS45565_g05213 [Spizellomyces sp. 'palustris']
MKLTMASLLLLAIIGAVSAQLSAIPGCATACVEHAIAATGCAFSAITCICTSAVFLNTLGPCVQTTCPANEQAATFVNVCTECGSPGCLGAAAMPNLSQA